MLNLYSEHLAVALKLFLKELADNCYAERFL